MDEELTMSEILTDPLIRVMLTADGISLTDFANFLHEAALRLQADTYVSAAKAHSLEADPIKITPTNPCGAVASFPRCTVQRGIGLAFA